LQGKEMCFISEVDSASVRAITILKDPYSHPEIKEVEVLSRAKAVYFYLRQCLST
jgi:hypothetical protein